MRSFESLSVSVFDDLAASLVDSRVLYIAKMHWTLLASPPPRSLATVPLLQPSAISLSSLTDFACAKAQFMQR